MCQLQQFQSRNGALAPWLGEELHYYIPRHWRLRWNAQHRTLDPYPTKWARDWTRRDAPSVENSLRDTNELHKSSALGQCHYSCALLFLMSALGSTEQGMAEKVHPLLAPRRTEDKFSLLVVTRHRSASLITTAVFLQRTYIEVYYSDKAKSWRYVQLLSPM